MPEQLVVKQVEKKENGNALKKIQLKHVTAKIRGKETVKGSTVKVKALSDSGAEIPVISEELIEGMNLEQVGEISLQCVAGEAIPAKLVKVDARLCEMPNDTDEETRTNQVKFTITPYVSLVCACIAGMGKILTTSRDHCRIKGHSTSEPIEPESLSMKRKCKRM